VGGSLRGEKAWSVSAKHRGYPKCENSGVEDAPPSQRSQERAAAGHEVIHEHENEAPEAEPHEGQLHT
jgi:hypothetical protein